MRVDPDFVVPYPHPSLEEPLRETLGTIIFQDQVLEVAQAFARFSPGEAEGLRRAMSRRRSEAAIRAYQERFVTGAMEAHADVDRATADGVWSMVVGFSGFGFPKAHGAAFGLLAYQSTWLRVHYAPEFLCALLDEQPMGFYPPDALVHEAQRRGLEVLAPDVNASAVGCTVTTPAEVSAEPARPGAGDPRSRAASEGGGAIRLGLGYVLGVRGDEVEALVAAREAGGPFRSLEDLAARAGAGRPALEQLAWSGACDGLARASGGVPRRSALWQLGVAAPGVPVGEQGTQLALALPLAPAPQLPALTDWGRMIADYATTGVAIDHHPMELLRPGLKRDGVIASRDLEALPHGHRVRIGGLVMARQRPGTANGVSFLLLEDEFGTSNLIVPPAVYERHRTAVRSEPLVVAEGTLERFASAGGAINILVRSLRSLESPDEALASVHALPDQAHEPVPLDVVQERKVRAARAEREESELVAAAGGGGDFRAVAPPVMSFAQGRRR
jgi:error-prone DNA polymerase